MITSTTTEEIILNYINEMKNKNIPFIICINKNDFSDFHETESRRNTNKLINLNDFDNNVPIISISILNDININALLSLIHGLTPKF